jgi:DNA transformation protein
MPVSREYIQSVMDLLEPLGEIQGRALFGGYAISYRGLTFALVADDVLYFKVNQSNLGDYEKAGSSKFPHGISYWEVPADILEDVDAFKEWADKSIHIAIEADARKAKKKKT